MSRIDSCLEQVSRDRRTAFVSFITAGDPTLETTVPALHALVAGGVDILELGVPFSDPEADGPAIQRSSERALKNGVTLRHVIAMVEEFRNRDRTTPIVLMGYLNSFLAMGVDNFARMAAHAGVDGLIIVNLPPEESAAIRPALSAHGLDLILLIAPTTPEARMRLIVQHASGFIYFVALKGITGADHLSVEGVADKIQAIRKYTKLPVFMGFGIKTPSAAKLASDIADGVVVGSALVETMAATACATEMTRALTHQADQFSSALRKSDLKS